MPTVHVVPHTHWDREWYRSAAVFGVRLARLADDLLDTLAQGRAIPSFLLDGQTVVLDDLAEMRPDRLAELRRLLRARRLEVGPWYVLADEFLVSPEALVRNLLQGRSAAQRHGGAVMRVGYVPDSFGHAGVVPTILAGFGIEFAVAWRGLGGERERRRDGESDLYRWRAADGSEVLLLHLPKGGYEYGANLPVEPRAAAATWRDLAQRLGSRARSPHWLVLNGADHHALQRRLPEAVRALGWAAGKWTGAQTHRRTDAQADARIDVRLSRLGDFAKAVLRWARDGRAGLPVASGELREGRRHAWALVGTTGTRLRLKQANASSQRTLERIAEPLAALASRSGVDLRGDLGAAWRELLRNQPHDSICGTSTDEVHAEMTTRFARVRGMAGEVVQRALDAAIDRDADAARELPREAWRPALLVFNPVPRRRDALVEAEVAVFRDDVRVGLVAANLERAQPHSRTDAQPRLELSGSDGRVVPHQELARWEGTDLIESPRRYPDCDAVEWRRIVFPASALPPVGVAAFAVRTTARPSVRPSARPPVRLADHGLDNGRLWLRVESDGTVALADRATGLFAHGLGRLEDQADLGDSYTPSPRGPVTSRPDAVAVRVIHAGPLVGELEIVRRFGSLGLEVVTRVRLEAGADHVTFAFDGVNNRGDHRLRVAFPLGERATRTLADTGFGIVARPPARRRPRRSGELEAAEPTAPLQRWAAVAGARRGLVVVSDGLPQYEASPDGTVRVTLLRACGELSRNDLPERSGHAGWPTPTPEGQCLGPFSGRIAVALVARGALADPAQLEAIADDVLLPPLASQRRALARVPDPVPGPRLEGEGLVMTAMKPAEDGRGVVLRCWNAGDGAVRGAWVLPWRVRGASLSRLDETDVAALKVARDRIAFEAPPRGVVTVRVR